METIPLLGHIFTANVAQEDLSEAVEDLMEAPEDPSTYLKDFSESYVCTNPMFFATSLCFFERTLDYLKSLPIPRKPSDLWSYPTNMHSENNSEQRYDFYHVCVYELCASSFPPGFLSVLIEMNDTDTVERRVVAWQLYHWSHQFWTHSTDYPDPGNLQLTVMYGNTIALTVHWQVGLVYDLWF